jgi:hypothetical protein
MLRYDSQTQSISPTQGGAREAQVQGTDRLADSGGRDRLRPCGVRGHQEGLNSDASNLKTALLLLGMVVAILAICLLGPYAAFRVG